LRKLSATPWGIGFSLWVWLGLPAGAAPPAFCSSPPVAFPSAPEAVWSPLQHPLAAAQATGSPSQGEKPSLRNVEGPENADDDPQQIERFRDLIAKKSFQDVEPQLLSYLAAHPRSWKAYYCLGYVQLRQRRVGDSIKSLSKSLQLNPNNAEAHKILARDLVIIGRYDYALREFQAALRLDPTSAEVHYNCGRIYTFLDEFGKARAELEKAIRLDAKYMEAYNALGFAVEALGDDAGALENYLTAIRLNEERHAKFDAAYVNLSAYYRRRGKLDLAMEYAHRALALNPQSDLAYFQIAKTCRAQQDWPGVVAALEKAIAISSSRPEYFYVLGIAYGKLGRSQESERALQIFHDLEKQGADYERQRADIHRVPQRLELRPIE
jgi:tetratricopeptide (TPR) repeat protein